MIALVLFAVRGFLVFHLMALQPLDVISTNKALKHPLVVEQGDEPIGLGNAAGWAMKHWGPWWWWLVKLPLLVLAPLGWVHVPVLAEPGLILLLVAANAYFLKIVRQNFRNAALPIPVRFTGPPLGASAYVPFSEEKK